MSSWSCSVASATARVDVGGGGVLIVFGAVVGDVEALVGGGFAEGDGVGGGGG